MSQAFRCLAVLLALTTVSAAYRPDDKPGQDHPDAAIYHALRDVINRGADVYNDEDYAGCYRIFEGGLIAFKGQLAHRPDLQKIISTALTSAEADPLVWRRAFTLRAALDKLRKELNPKKDSGGGKSPPAEKDKSEKDKDGKDQPMPEKDKDKKDEKDKDKKDEKDKDKTGKDKGEVKPPPPPGSEQDKDKGKKDEQPKDKQKRDDLQAERLPPPFREKVAEGEKKDA